MNEITKKIEEALGVLWHLHEHGIKEEQKIKEILEKGLAPCPEPLVGVLDELQEKKFIHIEKKEVEFTKEGEAIAKIITRRHRLAERLLTDILEIEEIGIEKSACEFEHILSPEVTDSICTLLGHPKYCPHNSPIPPGECCLKFEREVKPVVISLNQLKSGEKGKILYFSLTNHQQLHKLLSLGIIPGKTFYLHQTFPAFVLKIDELQIALDEDLAKSIYIRKV
jgi:DtxR family Mn-dependent transcriptional regulator